MDLKDAKRILRLIAGDKSPSMGAWENQEICAAVILKDLRRLGRIEKDFLRLQKMVRNASITIEVSGGIVQNVYTTLGFDVEVDVLDFDENGDRPDDDRNEREAHLQKVIAKQRQIY